MTDDAFLEFVKKKRDAAAEKEGTLCDEPGCLNNEDYTIANVTMNLLNEVINEYERHHPTECPFCIDGADVKEKKGVVKGDHWYILNDAYPVSDGHVLIIPYRHVVSIWDLKSSEIEEFPVLLKRILLHIDMRHHPDGYNIGMNFGEAAGQTVKHLHVHVIPRYKGDMINPRGGIRGCIPDKRKYDDPRMLALHGAS